jgi:hypothetical protein
MLKEMDDYQQGQRKRTLSVIAWIILFAAIILGVLNIQYKTWTSVMALFGMALFCVPIIILNLKNYYTTAGILLNLIILIVISLSLYDGDGILDSGILAYPVLIVCGALLFGRRFISFVLLGSIVSFFAMVYLENVGKIHPTIHPAKFSDLAPIIIILLIASLVVWVVMNNYENNLNRITKSKEELYKNNTLTLEAWAKVLEYRDRETAGHSTRLVEISTKLAIALECSAEEIEHLRSGALLHDIGKLAVPDSILLKSAKLDESEMAIMKKHPAFGKEMLSGVSFLEPSLPVVFSHHEHWDGQGYPLGLKGENIPLLARIFTIVDCWDALNSDRPYREAWPREKIINYIRDNSTVLFDPHIVEVFLKII